ncbi:MAG: hypothetical protein CL532_00545 [Aestuariivita sp.]|nr:hypothetical protein [Aestuariivita sp.]
MANVTYTVNTTTRDMILKQYTTMTINSGDTVTADEGCRGLFIYVQGDCTIDGTLSMSSTACSGTSGGQYRGSAKNPTSDTSSSDGSVVSSTGLRLPLVASGGTETLSAADFAGCGNDVVGAVANQPAISGNGKIFTIERTGGAGGAGGCGSSFGSFGGGTLGGASSVTGTTLTPAGGTSGQGTGDGATRCSGTGGQGSCFGGGGGSGGTSGSVGHTTDDAVFSAGSSGYTSGGGWWGQTSGNGGQGAGTIILIVGGDLTIGASGSIQANGSGGGNGVYYYISDGGAGAGGNILIAYAGTFTNNGSITATGGSGCGSTTARDGAVLTQQITY